MARRIAGRSALAVRALVVVALCLALCLAVRVAPAPADAQAAAPPAARPDVQLSLSPRWSTVAGEGGWTAYALTVVNRTARTVAGTVVVEPAGSAGGTAGGAVYRLPVSVPGGGRLTRDVSLTGVTGGYRARLVAASGAQLALAPGGGAALSRAVAVLSDVPDAAEMIATPLRADRRPAPAVTRIDGAAGFPSDPVRLVGLAAVVVDRFDSSALTRAQVGALTTFVGMGGTLVLGGGTSAPAAVAALPATLVPLRPDRVQPAPLGALADLAGQTSPAAADVVAGGLRDGARVALRTPSGIPLVVEAGYGAGTVVQLAFDPLADPFGAAPVLASSAWALALAGASDPTPGAPAADAGGDGAPAAAVGGGQADTATVANLLLATQPASMPPLGLLLVLLALYVALAGGVGYLALRGVGRRSLMWATVPVLALLFTGGAFAAGYGGRGAAYVDNAVEVQRVAPDGAVERETFHGIFAPRRGDVSVRLPGSSMVAPWAGPGVATSARSVVALGPGPPSVRLLDVPVWNLRSLQTLSLSRSSDHPSLSADLRVEANRLRGTVVNRTGEDLAPLELFTAGRGPVLIADRVDAGARIDVDLPAAMLSIANQPASDDARRALAGFAARSMGATSDLTLVGIGPGRSGLVVDGAPVSRTSLAAFVAPVGLRSADALVAPPRPELVSSVGAADGQIDVYDLDLPTGLSRPLVLTPSPTSIQAASNRIDVYDWGSSTWRPLAIPGPGAPSPAVALTGSEAQGGVGVVRLRVHEATAGQLQLELGSR